MRLSLAVFLGFIVGAGTVIASGVSEPTALAFENLPHQGGETATQSHKAGKKNSDPEVLTLGDSTHFFRVPGTRSRIGDQAQPGPFTHPANTGMLVCHYSPACAKLSHSREECFFTELLFPSYISWAL